MYRIINLFGPGILFSAIAFQITFSAIISKSELRKAMILYNLQTDALRAKLEDTINLCRQQHEEGAVNNLKSALELLLRRQETVNQIFAKPFAIPMKDQLLQGASKTLISVKNALESIKC